MTKFKLILFAALTVVSMAASGLAEYTDLQAMAEAAKHAAIIFATLLILLVGETARS